MSQTQADDPDALSAGTTPRGDAALPPQPAPRRSGRGSLAALVLGGAVAGGLGFSAARLDMLSPDTADQSVQLAALEQALGALAEETATLRADLAAVPPPQTEGLAARLEAQEAQLAALNLGALESRLTALEARAEGGLSPADRAALNGLRAEIEAIKAGGIAQAQIDAASAELAAALDRAKAAAEAMQASTLAQAAASARQGALLQIGAALDAGAPYGFALQAFDGVALPEPLVAGASGLPGLKALQDSFPPAARAALEAALKADMGQTWTERALSFLRTQVGARSLTARAGDDPDAILSRAEAALAAGDVGAALAELGGLPDVAQTALAGWRADAERRQTALEALATLTADLAP
ncbi:MAG: COG4223 family protein [Paracoccaceae bacterium]